MQIIAHRAGTDHYPEQTMCAALYSMGLGTDWVEMDVRFTREGTPVVCHDPNAQRIFGVDQDIAEMDLTSFLQMRFTEDPVHTPYTLEDALRRHIGPLLLHCKLPSPYLMPVLWLLRKHGYGGNVALGVSDTESVQLVKAFDPRMRVLAFMPSADALADFAATGCDFIRLWEPWVTKARVDDIHAAGKLAWVMSGSSQAKTTGYTSREALLSWRDMGVDGVLINEVRWAQSILAQGGSNQ